MNQNCQEVSEALQAAERILIVSHRSPDPDAYGSSLGLYWALKAIGKEVKVLNESGIIESLTFIPGTELVLDTIPEGEWDLLVYCDCGDEKRVGDSFIELLPKSIRTINIDHHASNSNFADINYVRDSASSTAELVFEVISELTAVVEAQSAECLMAGLYGDTGSFRYSTTTAEVFELAAKLTRCGAKPSNVASSLYDNKRPEALLLQGEAIKRLEVLADGAVAITSLPEALFREFNAREEDTEEIAELLRSIRGVSVVAFLRQVDDTWRVSLRSTSERFNVSEVAKNFGGGGHRQASGFRFRGQYEDLYPELSKQLEALALA